MGKKILFLLMAGGLWGACVKEVDFSGAYEKKVVVNCILNYTYYEHHDPTTPNQELLTGETFYYTFGSYSSSLNGKQTLYLSYNKTNGDYENIPDAEAVLFDDNTGEIIGNFKKDSTTSLPGRWTLDYSIPCTDNENIVSVHCESPQQTQSLPVFLRRWQVEAAEHSSCYAYGAVYLEFLKPGHPIFVNCRNSAYIA